MTDCGARETMFQYHHMQ